MDTEAQEPALPYTPSNTGRRARVGYLGFDGVGFDSLWPLFLGLVLSVALSLHLFLGPEAARGRWLSRTLFSACPVALGYGYLRFLVQGRPPHFKGDLVERARSLALDFSDPPLRALPILPRLVDVPLGAPSLVRSSGETHPMRVHRR